MSCSDDDRYSNFDISLAGGPFFSFRLAFDHKGTPKSEDSYFPYTLFHCTRAYPSTTAAFCSILDLLKARYVRQIAAYFQPCRALSRQVSSAFKHST